MAALHETKAFKRIKNLILGAGAAVVLLGALFKILHWEGATEMLMIGMFTEAFIFLFLGILPPHQDYYWEKVYPHLDIAPDVVHKKKTKKGIASSDPNSSITKELDKMLEDAQIEQEMLHRLGENLGKLGDNIAKLGDVTDAGVATSEYSKSASEAAVALRNMKDAYSNASAAVMELTDISTGTKEYHEQVQLVSKNLAALNAVYELELQDTNNHLKSMNRFYGSLSEAMNNLNESVEDTRTYREEISTLSKNLTQLNSVYGSMLAAMTIRPQQ